MQGGVRRHGAILVLASAQCGASMVPGESLNMAESKKASYIHNCDAYSAPSRGETHVYIHVDKDPPCQIRVEKYHM